MKASQGRRPVFMSLFVDKRRVPLHAQVSAIQDRRTRGSRDWVNKSRGNQVLVSSVASKKKKLRLQVRTSSRKLGANVVHI